MYDAEGFLSDPSRIGGCVRLDAPLLGDVAGKRLLHLQCHFGKDTLGWARLGAEVTGIDFSEAAIVEARRFADAAGLDARFILSDLYDAPAVLDEEFDVVYTGITPGDDEARARKVVTRYREAGVTWWLEAIAPYRYGRDFDEPWDLEVLRERVLQGPPRVEPSKSAQ